MKDKIHTITLSDRTTLGITAVQAILAFDEGYVSLSTEQGGLIIEGEGLEIEDLSSENQTIRIKGKVTLLEYRDQKKRGGLFGKK